MKYISKGKNFAINVGHVMGFGDRSDYGMSVMLFRILIFFVAIDQEPMIGKEMRNAKEEK